MKHTCLVLILFLFGCSQSNHFEQSDSIRRGKQNCFAAGGSEFMVINEEGHFPSFGCIFKKELHEADQKN